MDTFYTISIFLIVYLICSINPAIIICKIKTGEDIRKLGSGNAGSANAMRVLGKLLGTVVVILDEVKVCLALIISLFVSKLFGHDFYDPMFRSVIILATVIGHCFPVFYGFRGGKGVIVGITVIAIFDPKNALICAIASIIVMLVTRTVSIGTIAGILLYVIISFVMGYEYLIPILVACAIVLFKHRQSIFRILTKQEGKFKLFG